MRYLTAQVAMKPTGIIRVLVLTLTGIFASKN